MKNMFKKYSFAAMALALVLTVSVTQVQAADTVSVEKDLASQSPIWSTDRKDPSSFTVSGAEIAIDINSTTADATDNFVRTEGKKAALANNATAIEATIHLDSAWENTAVRSGLWATADATTPEWGIIDYTRSEAYSFGTTLTKSVTFRIWDSVSGTWTNVGDKPLGSNVTLRIELKDGEWVYFINGNEVGRKDLDDQSATDIKEVILNSYNFGAENVSNVTSDLANTSYTVVWSDLKVVTTNTIQDVIAAATAGDTITLSGDVTTSLPVIVDKAITIDGAGYTLTLNAPAAPGTTSGLGLSAGATVKNLVVTGTTNDNLVEVTGNATIKDVTVKNSLKAGIIVLDGATLSVEGAITLTENMWGGIEVKNAANTKLSLVNADSIVYTASTVAEFEKAPIVWIDADALETAGEHVIDAEDRILATPKKQGIQVWWTKYVAPARVGGGGGGGSSRSTSTTPTPTTTPTTTPSATTTPEGQVLGETTFNFTTPMRASSSTSAEVKTSVMELQKFLNAGNFGVLAVDGAFGPKTKAAVMAFQRANLLVADGIVGPKTLAALNK